MSDQVPGHVSAEVLQRYILTCPNWLGEQTIIKIVGATKSILIWDFEPLDYFFPKFQSTELENHPYYRFREKT